MSKASGTVYLLYLNFSGEKEGSGILAIQTKEILCIKNSDKEGKGFKNLFYALRNK